MTTTRTHLKEMHTAHAEFHVRAAAAHAKLARCFGKMEIEGADDASAAHQELAKAHADAAEHSVQCAKALDASNKATMGGDDGDALVPIPGISSVYKVDPPRPVPRFGSPQMNDVSAVDPAFRKLVSIEGDED